MYTDSKVSFGGREGGDPGAQRCPIPEVKYPHPGILKCSYIEESILHAGNAIHPALRK